MFYSLAMSYVCLIRVSHMFDSLYPRLQTSSFTHFVILCNFSASADVNIAQAFALYSISLNLWVISAEVRMEFF